MNDVERVRVIGIVLFDITSFKVYAAACDLKSVQFIHSFGLNNTVQDIKVTKTLT